MIHERFNTIASAGHPQRDINIYEIGTGVQCRGDYVPVYSQYEWHHVIPQTLRNHDLFKEGNALGLFNFDQGKNCVALPTKEDECEKVGPDSPTQHDGRHIKTYDFALRSVLDRWDKNIQNERMTTTQVRQEFASLLKNMRVHLDPSLRILEGFSPTDPINGRIMLSYKDPNLGSDQPFISEFIPEPDVVDKRCDEAAANRIALSRNNSIPLIEAFDKRATAIANGQVLASDIIPAMNEPTQPDRSRVIQLYAQADQINEMYGYGLMAAGAVIAAPAVAMEIAPLAVPLAVDSSAVSLRVVADNAPKIVAVTKDTALESLKYVSGRAAAFIGGLSLSDAASSSQAKADTVTHTSPNSVLPPLSQLNAGSDMMGDRSDVNNISWRFTGVPAGDSGNALSALYLRDIQAGKSHNGAHLLLQPNGTFERSETLSRPWESNPQIHAGHNGDAIGVYVAGCGQVTESQRTSLSLLNTSLCSQRQQSGLGLSCTALMPSGYTEQNAWDGSIQRQPIPQQPRPQNGLAAGLR